MASVPGPSNVTPHLPPPPPPPQNYLFETLPIPVVGKVGDTVPLSTILTTEFGKNLDGYKDFYIGYFGMDALQLYSPWLSYWNATPKIYDAWTSGKGPPAGLMTQWVGGLAHGSVYGLASASFDQLPAPDYTPKLDLGPNVYHVTAATMGNYGLAIGSDIAPFAYIVVPIAYDGSGHPTEFAQYSITTCDPSLASTTLGSAPKPSDVVAAAKRFAADPSLSNVKAPNDCENIAQDVSSAAGAALADPTGSDVPSDNQSGGYWRIVYRGSDPGAIQNWSSLVKPGDIVRMGWDGGGGHTTTVVAVNPKANADGSHNLEVYDNATTYETIQLHWDTNDGKNTLNESWTYDTKGTGTDPTTITIYRLSPDHLFLIQGSDTGSWLAGNGMNDKIVGGAGDDFLVGGAGNNVLDGGGGTNTAVFFGPRSEYDITSYTSLKDGLVHTIVTDTGSAGDGTDDLVRIQHLQFSDWTYGLNGSQLTPLWRTLNDADAAPPALANQVLPPNLGSIAQGASVVPQINALPHVAMGGGGGGGAAGLFGDGATHGSEAFTDADGPLSHGNSSWLQLTQAMASFDADRGISHARLDWNAAESGAQSFIAAAGPFHH